MASSGWFSSPHRPPCLFWKVGGSVKHAGVALCRLASLPCFFFSPPLPELRSPGFLWGFLLCVLMAVWFSVLTQWSDDALSQWGAHTFGNAFMLMECICYSLWEISFVLPLCQHLLSFFSTSLLCTNTLLQSQHLNLNTFIIFFTVCSPDAARQLDHISILFDSVSWWKVFISHMFHIFPEPPQLKRVIWGSLRSLGAN